MLRTGAGFKYMLTSGELAIGIAYAAIGLRNSVCTMRCPVLLQRLVLAISLRARYAMSGADLAFGGIGLRTRYAMSGTDLACPGWFTRGLRALNLRVYGARVYGAICLCPCYEMPGTARGYAATVSGADLAYGATSHNRLSTLPLSISRLSSLTVLDLHRYHPTRFQRHHSNPRDSQHGALSAYALATECPVLTYLPRACYAMSGTDMAHTVGLSSYNRRISQSHHRTPIRYQPLSSYARATKCPVLTVAANTHENCNPPQYRTCLGLAAELESIQTHHNPIIAPPPGSNQFPIARRACYAI
eukprot:1646676-Rhodomonas_salina.3